MTASPFDDPGALVLDFDDPAPAGSGDPYLSGGRYRYPNRDGSKKSGGWQRASNLASAISDQRQLQDWTVRTTLAGLATDPSLYAELQAIIAEVGTDKADLRAAQDRILDLAERAKDAAGGGYGRERGNRVHDLVEADWAGLPPGTVSADERDLLRAIRAALAEAQLQPIPGMQERIVLIEELEACGKWDSLARDLVTDYVHVIDTKTQYRFWTWLEVEAQLAEYAHAVAMWDAKLARWVDMPYEIEQTRGAAVHCPEIEHGDGTRSNGPVTIKPLDLERGWETAQLARRNVVQRSACGSARQAVSGRTWAEVRPSTLEMWAARLRDVDSPADGARVWAEAEAAGAATPELRQVALEVASRFALVSA